MDFKDIISQFTDTDKSKIGVYMVHLERATEREQIIKELFEKLNVLPDNIIGIDGKKIVENGHPTLTRGGHNHGWGQVGCTVTHLEIFKNALQNGKEYAVIFEDDTICKKNISEINSILSSVKNIFKTYDIHWDLFLLGALGYQSFLPNQMGISSVYFFHGSHAILVNKKFMHKFIEIYFNNLVNGRLEAADGLYSDTIRQGSIALGFTEPKLLFDQKQQGMYSYIREKINTE